MANSFSVHPDATSPTRYGIREISRSLSSLALDLENEFHAAVEAEAGERTEALRESLQREASRVRRAWDELPPEDRHLHLKAQRAGRALAAEIRLYCEDAVQRGRAEKNLYAHLQVEIDSRRDRFHRDFLLASDSMVDYFHLELLRALANDHEELLGPDYPGPLV